MSEFNLSDKIVHEEAIKAFIDIRSDKWIKMEDVREFIKRLKDRPKFALDDVMILFITEKELDKLAGEKLIGPTCSPHKHEGVDSPLDMDSEKSSLSQPEGSSKDVCENCGKERIEHFSKILYCKEAEFEDYQKDMPMFKPKEVGDG